MIKGFENLKAGLLGEKLGHSFSPQIHAQLADYSYQLFEVENENLDEFMQKREFDAINVTIPYKKAVMPYLDYISDDAKKIGCVNTIVKKDGKLCGYNTDYYGFMHTVKSAKVDLSGKKALILGTGGASLTVRAVLEDCGVKTIINISRSGENNYDNLHLHYDADVIVNATPVGMYPNCDAAPIDLSHFTNCKAVFDLIYNPLKTKLLCDAQKCGMKYCNGLKMLCFQAKKASEFFCDAQIDDALGEKIEENITNQMSNIALIGMAGCGKSTIGKALSQRLDCRLIDTDLLVEQNENTTIPQIFETKGEEYFRECETKALKSAAYQSGVIISTGGGIVTQQRNLDILRKNCKIVYIKRDLEKLTSDGRPLSQKHGVQALFEKRKALYESFADYIVDNNGDINNTVDEIINQCCGGKEV